MNTIFDWATLAVFAGLVVLFLQRSTADTPRDKVWHYLPPAGGCALANYLGNEGQTLLAIGVIAAIGAYVWLVLKPLE